MDRVPFDPYDFSGYLASGLLLLIGMQLTLGFPEVLGSEFKVFDGAAILLAVYVAGQLVATPAKAILEDGLVDKVLGRPSVNLFRDTKPVIRGFIFPGFYKALPQAIANAITAKAKHEGVTELGEPLFLHVRFSPGMLSNEQLMRRLATFLGLYGFARNLAFTSFLVG